MNEAITRNPENPNNQNQHYNLAIAFASYLKIAIFSLAMLHT